MGFFSIKMNTHFHKQNYIDDKTKKIKNITKYNNINNTRNYTNTEP